jgi:hypothetical protein
MIRSLGGKHVDQHRAADLEQKPWNAKDQTFAIMLCDHKTGGVV